MPIYLRGLGNVAAFNSVAVKTRVDGQLIAIHFQEGQFVQAGDLIAEIDPRPFQVQLEQAQGQLARDQAQLNDANVNLARYQALWEAQVIPKQQLDTQAAQVGQFKGTIEADKAAIDNAKLQLIYARITAPIGGRVGLRQIDVGNIVHASDATGIVSIDQIEPISVFFTIPADSLPPVLKKLRAGAKLRVDAYDRSDTNKIASGTLLTVDNQIDPNTGTSRLKSVFDNADHALFPNQFVNCRLLLDITHGIVIIPSAAIERGPQGTYVYVVKDNTANLRVITAGATEGNNTAIDSGLQPGEMVVIDGQDKLQEGSKVDARAPNPNRPPRRANKP
jgi:multidrug efflux system membrane fusion protein